MAHYIEHLLNTTTRHTHYTPTIARPERGGIWFRVSDAWQVLIGKASAVTFYEDMTPSLWCPDCDRYETTTIYNDTTTPMMLCCENCGQFLQQPIGKK